MNFLKRSIVSIIFILTFVVFCWYFSEARSYLEIIKMGMFGVFLNSGAFYFAGFNYGSKKEKEKHFLKLSSCRRSIESNISVVSGDLFSLVKKENEKDPEVMFYLGKLENLPVQDRLEEVEGLSDEFNENINALLKVISFFEQVKLDQSRGVDKDILYDYLRVNWNLSAVSLNLSAKKTQA